MVGKTIAGRYQIMARIGKGSVGSIFRAFDTVTEKQVALKLLRRNFVRDEELRRRFEQEAMALKMLQHKNITAVREFSFENNEPFFVMEYIDGETLSELIGDLTYIPKERFVPIFVQICDALMHAHERGILHRDIKPANIMLVDLPRQKDIAKLLDFGLAKFTDEAAMTRQLETTGSRVLGTPLYMSPEQARGHKVDGRSDIYALGCVMYEALCGLPPISGKGFVEILRNQMTVIPPSPATVRPNAQIPAGLDALVMKALEKDPDLRYQSVPQLATELKTFLPPRAEPSSGTQPVYPLQPQGQTLVDKIRALFKRH